jgi:hypothetical protein
VARNWNDESPTLAALEARLQSLAPGNVSDMPISSAKQKDDNGSWAWTVDLHVRIPNVTEYEVTGVGRTFTGALRRAYLGLNNEQNVRRMAHAANAAFGVTP